MSREEKIIAMVSKQKKIEVNRLAELLEVSKVTIRKDLDKLEARGILHRQHGFALLNNEADINYRLAKNYELKLKIAKKAAESVADGEMVMVESGSTCTLLAEQLAFHRRDITIITNSSFIASHIRKAENVKIVLLGGEYQKESQVNVGPLIRQVIENFHVDKIFLGVDGCDLERGFTGSDINRCDTAKVMAAHANKTILLTDSSKFHKKGAVAEFAFKEVAEVYTDQGIPVQIKAFLEKEQISVITT
ncbi:DeoR/GlpR family DNA-binding transcription regulator [Enterococcus sp. BWR-S5]|uniref:DeoR/GlpR family DNA-binding transcription regulator n=1 Tax=Enterococcus sp. BWR-S5 TaxID=2787714 RepID=UPI001921C18F|nr:DeoR/GlpR family DNA-binding transcription regulator [Enterococcus sp. BWR-S5]MBL1223776.1 DeoR/GlpR transcriptional regulator [Enterococcus sp. BWR-S5]